MYAETQYPDSPLHSLRTDLLMLADSLQEIAAEVVEEGVSNYPVFIAHRHSISIGEPVFTKADVNTEWDIHLSTLDELQTKKVIPAEKTASFVANYKDYKKFACVLVLEPEGANFLFFPYKSSNQE